MKRGLAYRLESFESEDGEISPRAEAQNKVAPATLRSDSFGTEHEQMSLENRGFVDVESEIETTNEKTSLVQKPDCCCPPGFFTLRMTILLISVLLFASIIFVIVLDLVILEAERIGRNRPYYYDPEHPTQVDFVLRGTPTAYEEFELIPYDRRSSIRTIELDYVHINIKKFVDMLYHGFEDLESITMTNVKFNGTMPWSERPYRPPKLKSFTLIYNEPIGPSSNFTIDLCDDCSGGWNDIPDLSQFINETCLQGLIFFKSAYHKTGDLGALEFNVNISIWGITYFSLNYDRRELISTLPYISHYIESINANPQMIGGLKILRLRQATLDVTTFNTLSSSLEVFHLDGNVTGLEPGQRVSQFLTNFTRLQELTLKFGHYAYADSEDLKRFWFLTQPPYEHVVYLNDLPTTLKNLTLAFLQLNVDTNSSINFHLDKLVLYQVQIKNQLILQNFSRYFKTSRVAWQIWNGTSTQSYTIPNWKLILTTLLSSESEWIFIDNSFGGKFKDIEHGDFDDTMTPIQEIQSQILQFVQENDMFTLTKKNRTLEWTNLDNLVISDPLHPKLLWFKLLNIGAFVSRRIVSKINFD